MLVEPRLSDLLFGPLRPGLRPPRRAALQDGDRPPPRPALDPSLVQDPLGHPLSTPPFDLPQGQFRNRRHGTGEPHPVQTYDDLVVGLVGSAPVGPHDDTAGPLWQVGGELVVDPRHDGGPTSTLDDVVDAAVRPTRHPRGEPLQGDGLFCGQQDFAVLGPGPHSGGLEGLDVPNPRSDLRHDDVVPVRRRASAMATASTCAALKV
ncbi:hypothetical protein OG494_36090 [Amycolatopsis sp. NBC_00438]